VFQFEDFALHIHRNLTRQVAARHGRGHFGDVTHLCGQVPGHGVDVVGEVFPGASHARHVRLPTQPSFVAAVARHARHLDGYAVALLHHVAICFFQLEDFAAHIHRNLTRQVAARDGRGYFGDVTHLRGQVTGHEVDVVGEVFPGAAHTGHLRL